MYLTNISLYSICIICMVAFIACKPTYQEENSEQDTIPKVYVKELIAETSPIPIHATGLIETTSEIRLSFKIGGIIHRMYVNEGQSVSKGQLLATLKLEEIDAQVTKATQARDKALRDLERAQRLQADTVITLEQLQNAQTAYEVAKSDVEIAQFNQQYARILSPSSGKILRKFTEPSELVSAGVPVYALGATQSQGAYQLSVGLADRDIVKIHLGDSASIYIDAYPDTSFQARVSEIGQAADPATGVFGIELTLSPTTFDLKNGFVGSVEIFPSSQQPYYKVPMSALIEGSRQEVKVFVPDEDSAVARLIAIPPQYIGDDYFTVLQKDWNAAKQVITEGAPYLSEGVKFTILEQQPSPNPSITSLSPR